MAGLGETYPNVWVPYRIGDEMVFSARRDEAEGCHCNELAPPVWDWR